MGGGEAVIVAGSGAETVAGIGCRPGCEAAELAALVRRAEGEAGCRAVALAAPEFRAAEARAAAALLALPLQLLAHATLEAAQPRCATHSEAALRSTGLASVAEACALAAAGPRAALRLPRIAAANSTCALAGIPA